MFYMQQFLYVISCLKVVITILVIYNQSSDIFYYIYKTKTHWVRISSKLRGTMGVDIYNISSGNRCVKQE
jgi:hypothetical protein